MNILSPIGAISNAAQGSFSPARITTPVPEAATNSTTLSPVSQTSSNRGVLPGRTDQNTTLDNSQNTDVSGADSEEDSSVASSRNSDSIEENSDDSNSEAESRSSFELTEQELATLQKLKSRDIEVRTHEQAHQAVGGQYASAPTYEFERGPDGKNYAVSGEVNIQLPSQSDDPEQVIRHADQVVRAALAPAQPSAQDRRVAAQATQSKVEAQQRLREQNQEEIRDPENEEESERSGGDNDAIDSDSSTTAARPQFAQFVESANIIPSNIIGEIFSISV